jgi:hypothetical protein
MGSMGGPVPTYILRRLHSAQACGVVILLAVPGPLAFALSGESEEFLRGVTPWKVWNMPPWVGTGIDGAMVYVRLCGSEGISRVSLVCWGPARKVTPGRWS